MKGYKWLTDDMKSSHGNMRWKLNEQEIHIGKLELCNSGFHACKTAFQSLQYVYGNRLFEVEAEDVIVGEDKFVASKMRLVKELPAKEIMVRFAIACARRSLHYFEEKYPNDDRPRKAIEAAEMGNISNAAAYAAYAAAYAADAAAAADAAYAAAYAADAAAATYTAAAADAAYAAAYAAYAAAAARAARAAYAAYAAAYAADAAAAADAAYAAAHAAADAGGADEQKWQSEKLEEIIDMEK